MADPANLAEIFEGVDQDYVLVDQRGRVTAMGPRAAALLGVTDVAAATGSAVARVIPARAPEGAVFSGRDSPLNRCLAGGAAWSSPVSGLVVTTPEGPRAIAIQLRPLTEGGAVVLVADATPIRDILDAHDALVSVTSHELKTPLTAIKAMAELMLSYELGDEQRRDMIGDIYRQAERLEVLIREILDASHIDSGRLTLDLEPTRVREALGEVLDELATQLENRRLKVRVPVDLPVLAADPAKLRQVLVNLITNALKYSPDSAPVEVQARVETGMVRIAVKDKGIGIKPEDQPRLFKRFQRIPDPSTRKTSGTGLGLYIVKGLVELHGGTIDVRSTYGKGSTFSFTMPVVEGAGVRS